MAILFVQLQPVVEKERTALLEVEGIPSKGISLYDQSQQKVAEILKIDVSHTQHNTQIQTLFIKKKC